MIKRITGVQNLCNYQGRQIIVAFTAPTRWKAFENDGKGTKVELGMGFDQIHAFVRGNKIKQRLAA